MACSDSPPCGRVRCVGQVHVSARTRTGLGGPAATPAHSEEVPTADTRHPWSSRPRPWREEGSDSSRPPPHPHLAEALQSSENKVAAISNFSVSQESSFQPSWSTAGGGAGVGTDPHPWRWGQAGRREPVS